MEPILVERLFQRKRYVPTTFSSCTLYITIYVPELFISHAREIDQPILLDLPINKIYLGKSTFSN